MENAVDSGAILVAGKALLWFAIPLGLALWDLQSLKAERRRRATRQAQEHAGEGTQDDD